MIDFLQSAVSIIILNWNGKDDTVECLESLYRNDYPFFCIILVDNASDDGLVEYVEEHFPEVTIIKNEQNLGFAEGNNVGIRYALEQQNPDYVLLLNNDTIVEPSFVTKLVAVGEKYPDVGMLSPAIYWYSQPDTIWFYGGERDAKAGFCDHKKLPIEMSLEAIMTDQEGGVKEYLSDSDYLSGCALLIKAGVIRQIGLLDARFFAYYEDADWCMRCKQAGWTLAVVPSARIWHKVASSSGGPYSLFFSHRNLILFLWKYSNIFHFVLQVKRFIYRTLAVYSWNKEKYYTTPELTALDGVWAGLLRRYGGDCQKMPDWMRGFVYRYIRYLLWIFRYPR